MASTLIQAADAVVAHIAAQAFGVGQPLNQDVTAARKIVARYDVLTLESDTKARATVVPTQMKLHKGDGKRRGTRGKVGWLYSVDLALHKRIENDAEVADMIELYEQVNDLFSNGRLPEFDSLHFVDSESDTQTIFDTKNIDTANVYLAVQTLTFAGER